jgi:mannose-6-phosphate isomerase-like protein (cupin superfamily)
VEGRPDVERAPRAADSCTPDVTHPLSPASILDVLRDLDRDRPTWRALARTSPEARWSRRVRITDCYDVWLIGWHERQGVDLHDHGGVAGGLLVLDGELRETSTRVEARPALVERRLRTGDAVAFGPGHVHWVVNAEPVPATSIHVYSPPLSAMRFFDYTRLGGLEYKRSEDATGRG